MLFEFQAGSWNIHIFKILVNGLRKKVENIEWNENRIQNISNYSKKYL